MKHPDAQNLNRAGEVQKKFWTRSDLNHPRGVLNETEGLLEQE